MRIIISGPSGTGKTTLAKGISIEFGIPYIKAGAKDLWYKHNIDNHRDLINKSLLNPSFALDYQLDLLNYRYKKLSQHKSYVTDRGPMDNLVYFFTQVVHNSTENVATEFIYRCTDIIHEICDKQILTLYPYNFISVENNGDRVNNKYYQLFTQQIYNWVLKYDLLEFRSGSISILPTDLQGIQQRQLMVNKWLS